MPNTPQHPLSLLYPSELSTIGLLYALKGVSQPAFYARRNPDTGRWEMRDLNSLLISRDQDEWTLTEARGINDKGQIVGWGRHCVVLPGRAILFVERGFVLTPTAPVIVE